MVLAALFVAHDAIYVARFGVGDTYARAMSAQGHDYWAPVSIVLAIGVATVALVGLSAYRRLRRAQMAEVTTLGPSYIHELASVWLRLFPSVAILFAVQENIEHLAVDGHLAGIAPLIGPGSAVVLPVLAITTFALAAVGAAVRWRIRVLEARIAAAVRQRFAKLSAISEPTGWRSIAAAIALHWIIGRRNAGRAPPFDLRVIAVPTA